MRLRRPRNSGMIDWLEPRRLLTYNVFGTSGPDVITMEDSTIFVNGVPQGTGGDSPVVIDAGGGDDSISVFFVDGNVIVEGGTGDDTLTVGNGNFGNNIDGVVTYQEPSVNSGNDSIIIDDTADGAHFSNKVTAKSFTVDAPFTPATVNFIGTEVESKTFQCSNNDDVFQVEGISPGTVLELGGGDDEVKYEKLNGDHVVSENLGLATVSGGAGDDKAIFDDSERDEGSLFFDVSAQGIQGQLLPGVEHAEIDGAFVEITGDPQAANLSVRTPSLRMGTQFPLPSHPVDLDSFPFFFAVTVQDFCNVEIYDDDANLTGSPLTLWTTGGTQNLSKGNFQLILPQPSIQPLSFVELGSAPVTFNVAGLSPDLPLTLQGGAGDDELHTVTFGGNFHNDDIQAVFLNHSILTLVGGGGTDLLDLDDKNHPLEFPAKNYTILENQLTQSPNSFGLIWSSFENVKFIGDVGDNGITFIRDPADGVTVDGGGGNDVIQSPSFSDHATAMISGGNGDDTVVLNDSAGAGVAEYGVTAGEVSFQAELQTRAFSIHSSIEHLLIEQNQIATLTIVSSTLPTMDVTINGRGGTDTFFVGGGDLELNGFNSVTLDGGLGDDLIKFDDHLDVASFIGADTMNMNTDELDKGTASIVYHNFELQQVQASAVGFGFENPAIVNLNTNTIPTTITGCFNRPGVINVGFVSLDPIMAPVTLVMGGVGGAIVNDQNSSGDKTYTLSSTSLVVSSGQTINFSGSGLTLNANGGNNAIAVNSSTIVEPFTINSGVGNDTVTVGAGDIDANLLRAVNVNGQNGTDLLTYDNHLDTSFEEQTLSDTDFTDGQIHPFSNVESVHVQTGPGGGNLNVTGTTINSVIDGGAGPDLINAGGGHLSSNIHSQLLLNGNGGSDSVVLDDHLNTAATTYNFDAGDVLRGLVDCSLFESAELRSGSADDSVTVNAASLDLSLFTGDGNDFVFVQDSDDFVTVDTGGENPDVTPNIGDALIINNDASAPGDLSAKVRLSPGSHDVIRQLRISSSNGTSVGVCQVPAGATLVIPDAFNPISLNGIIDMAGGSFVYHGAGAQQTTFFGFLQKGYANGSWDGYGIGQDVINSSLAHQTPLADALGYAKASGVFTSFPASFGGVSVDSSDLLIGYTLDGDANLDGIVNALDFNALASNFGINSFVNWNQGNFNYDFFVNSQDFTAIAMNFNQTLSPSAAPPAMTAPMRQSATNARALTHSDLFGDRQIGRVSDEVL